MATVISISARVISLEDMNAGTWLLKAVFTATLTNTKANGDVIVSTRTAGDGVQYSLPLSSLVSYAGPAGATNPAAYNASAPFVDPLAPTNGELNAELLKIARRFRDELKFQIANEKKNQPAFIDPTLNIALI